MSVSEELNFGAVFLLVSGAPTATLIFKVFYAVIVESFIVNPRISNS